MVIQRSVPIRIVDQQNDADAIEARFDATVSRFADDSDKVLETLSGSDLERLCIEIGETFDAVLPSLRSLRQNREQTDDDWAKTRHMLLAQYALRNRFHPFLTKAVSRFRLEDAELGQAIAEQVRAHARVDGVSLLLTAPFEASVPAPTPLATDDPLIRHPEQDILPIPGQKPWITDNTRRALDLVLDYAARTLERELDLRGLHSAQLEQGLKPSLVVAAGAGLAPAALAKILDKSSKPGEGESREPLPFSDAAALVLLSRIGHPCSAKELLKVSMQISVSDDGKATLLATTLSDSLRLIISTVS